MWGEGCGLRVEGRGASARGIEISELEIEPVE